MFAFFIFLLLALFIVINHKFRKSRYDIEEVIKEKEKRLFKLYSSLEELMGSAEDYIEEAKREIEKNKEFCAGAAAEIKSTAQSQRAENSEPPKAVTKAAFAHDGYDSVEQKVRQMKALGMDEETIAKELMLSRGEVSLILKINRQVVTN